jgi:hypothetical protein
MMREEGGYCIKPERVANGATRKEMKQIERAHEKKGMD